MAKTRSSSRRKEKQQIQQGLCYITASFNNTIISFTDPQGNVLAWCSTGAAGFRGSRKSTPFAARMAMELAIRKAREHGMQQIDVRVRGPGSGREAALRALAAGGLKVNAIRDVTPVPHNGCKSPKMRRI